MSKIKIGVLGGTRGLDFLTRVLVNHPCAEVTAICEAHAGLRERSGAPRKPCPAGSRSFPIMMNS